MLPEILVFSRDESLNEVPRYFVVANVLPVLFRKEDPKRGGSISIEDRRLLTDHLKNRSSFEVRTGMNHKEVNVGPAAADDAKEQKSEGGAQSLPERSTPPTHQVLLSEPQSGR